MVGAADGVGWSGDVFAAGKLVTFPDYSRRLFVYVCASNYQILFEFLFLYSSKRDFHVIVILRLSREIFLIKDGLPDSSKDTILP